MQQGDSNANSPPQSANQSAVHSPQMQSSVILTSQQNAFGVPYQIPATMVSGGLGYGNPVGQGGYGVGAAGSYGNAAGQGYGQSGQSYGHGQGITGYDQGITGYDQGITGYDQGITGYDQGITGYGSQQGYGGQLNSQTQAMHQSVMRHPSPGHSRLQF